MGVGSLGEVHSQLALGMWVHGEHQAADRRTWMGNINPNAPTGDGAGGVHPHGAQQQGWMGV